MILNCFTCKALVDAQEISKYEENITDDEDYNASVFDGETFVSTFKAYTFLKCPNCKNPFLTCTLYNDDFVPYYQVTTLYPTPNKTISSEVAVYIKKAFEEALLCFNTQAFTACVIMCRKTVEGICKEHKIQKGNLQDKLEAMKKQGIIDDNLFNWADALRLAGNDAAHDLDVTFSSEDAQDIINFTYAIIDYVFTYRKKFEEFKNRKNPNALQP
jgi:hypothetical protein